MRTKEEITKEMEQYTWWAEECTKEAEELNQELKDAGE